MIIQGVTLSGTTVYDSTFNSTGALLYLDAGNAASYSGLGTTWTDLSTNTNNATLTGSPAFTSAGTSSYFSFNGAGTQLASTATAKYNQTYIGKTVFVVARLTAITAGTYRCLFGTPTGTRNFNTYIYSPSTGVYQIHYSANGLGGFSNNLSLTTNQWFCATVTQTTGGLVSYYLNGQPVGTNTGVTFSQWVSNGNENVAYGDNYWYGDIPVVAVYGRALTADQVQQDYNSLRGRYGL
jgi:Concanavalin A-like lectin/glucanases superfamily